QVVDGGPSLRIAMGGEVTGRLVQQEVDALLAAQRLAVELDAVALEVDPMVGIAHGLAVDAHSSGGDPAPRLRARAEARLGEDALEGFDGTFAGTHRVQ